MATAPPTDRALLVRLLVWRQVLRRLQDALAIGVERLVLRRIERRAREQVTAVGLASLRVGPEVGVGVEPLGAVGPVVGGRPLDVVLLAEALVGDRAVVAQATARALLPRVERLLRRAPLDEWRAVLVLEAHPLGVVAEDVHVGSRLAWRLDRLLA